MNSSVSLSFDSPILITGSSGFVGKNLVENLKALGYTNLLLFDKETPKSNLATFAKQAQFVFHLAGVNRPKDSSEFYEGNADLTSYLLSLLQESENKAPVLLTSSLQAGNGSDYALSKEQAENAVFLHADKNQSPVFVYRLPGVFGKWSKPNYNTVVATFCHNIAHDLPIEIRDPAYTLPLCYIDDVIHCFINTMQTNSFSLNHEFSAISPVYNVSLGEIAELLQSFHQSRQTLTLPNFSNQFENKLYATYLSYLPEDSFSYPLTMHKDDRGSFTEFLRTQDRGQVSVNISNPGIVKGNHWHNTKNEKFLVVKGNAVIRFRKVGEADIISYYVNGDELQVVDIPVGYTHNIENVGEGQLVTVMWANEAFNPEKPDTNFLPV